MTLSKFTDEKVKDAQLSNVMKKVNAKLVRERKFGAEVRVKMKDGTRYTESRENPKGNPKNPMSLEDTIKKFKDNAILAISEKNAEALIAKLVNFEKLDNAEELFRFMN